MMSIFSHIDALRLHCGVVGHHQPQLPLLLFLLSACLVCLLYSLQYRVSLPSTPLSVKCGRAFAIVLSGALLQTLPGRFLTLEPPFTFHGHSLLALHSMSIIFIRTSTAT